MSQTATIPNIRRTTAFQAERDARDRAICDEYNRLAADPEIPRTEINRYLMEKYNLHSNGTLYAIRQRVARKAGKDANN